MTSITITKGAVETPIYLRMLNRHGLIAGATGTGKTVTLKVLTEKLSKEGIPVFLADIKGDLSGLAKAGQWTPKLEERYKLLGLTDPFEPSLFDCGMSLAKLVILFGRLSKGWGHCFFLVCLI